MTLERMSIPYLLLPESVSVVLSTPQKKIHNKPEANDSFMLPRLIRHADLPPHQKTPSIWKRCDGRYALQPTVEGDIWL